MYCNNQFSVIDLRTHTYTIQATIPRTIAACSLICPGTKTSAPAVDEAVAALAVDERETLALGVLVALTDVAEDADEAEADALWQSQPSFSPSVPT